MGTSLGTLGTLVRLYKESERTKIRVKWFDPLDGEYAVYEFKSWVEGGNRGVLCEGLSCRKSSAHTEMGWKTVLFCAPFLAVTARYEDQYGLLVHAPPMISTSEDDPMELACPPFIKPFISP